MRETGRPFRLLRGLVISLSSGCPVDHSDTPGHGGGAIVAGEQSCSSLPASSSCGGPVCFGRRQQPAPGRRYDTRWSSSNIADSAPEAALSHGTVDVSDLPDSGLVLCRWVARESTISFGMGSHPCRRYPRRRSAPVRAAPHPAGMYTHPSTGVPEDSPRRRRVCPGRHPGPGRCPCPGPGRALPGTSGRARPPSAPVRDTLGRHRALLPRAGRPAAGRRPTRGDAGIPARRRG